MTIMDLLIVLAACVVHVSGPTIPSIYLTMLAIVVMILLRLVRGERL